MKLYDVPRNSRVRITGVVELPIGRADTGVKEFNFDHIDGMYSFCTDDNGNIVHLAAWTDVEIV